MKLRSPILIKAAGFFAALLLRLWIGTLRYRFRCLAPDLSPLEPGQAGRYIYGFWHEAMLLPGYHFGRRDLRVLIGQHADGQLIAEAMRHLGFGLVRGSSTRGGVEALRRMMKLCKKAHFAVTPDGPRGPRRRVQLGIVYLAARTDLPIVAAGIAYDRPWRLRSWDRFALPKPWSRATCILAPPITVPVGAGKEQLEEYRQLVEDTLAWVTGIAERWAETGSCVELGKPPTLTQARRVA
jgi:lysophospholipid acyltransferase (LPLAT)-like uncharacterized protein